MDKINDSSRSYEEKIQIIYEYIETLHNYSYLNINSRIGTSRLKTIIGNLNRHQEFKNLLDGFDTDTSTYRKENCFLSLHDVIPHILTYLIKSSKNVDLNKLPQQVQVFDGLGTAESPNFRPSPNPHKIIFQSPTRVDPNFSTPHTNMTNIHGQFETVENDITQIRRDVDRFKSDIEGVGSGVSRLDEAVYGIGNDLNTKSTTEEVKRVKKDMETLIQARDKDIDNLSNVVTTLNGELTTLKADISKSLRNLRGHVVKENTGAINARNFDDELTVVKNGIEAFISGNKSNINGLNIQISLILENIKDIRLAIDTKIDEKVVGQIVHKYFNNNVNSRIVTLEDEITNLNTRADGWMTGPTEDSLDVELVKVDKPHSYNADIVQSGDEPCITNVKPLKHRSLPVDNAAYFNQARLTKLASIDNKIAELCNTVDELQSYANSHDANHSRNDKLQNPDYGELRHELANLKESYINDITELKAIVDGLKSIKSLDRTSDKLSNPNDRELRHELANLKESYINDITELKAIVDELKSIKSIDRTSDKLSNPDYENLKNDFANLTKVVQAILKTPPCRCKKVHGDGNNSAMYITISKTIEFAIFIVLYSKTKQYTYCNCRP
ncbi:hypothetical protein BC936DRAFT_148068 [Jimgerdemannia flammicorona]|uniref:Uncharacterized protein n=1 Tax=Jimgerdemannia flammicorona TaxID=994334 RepID=A0A433D3W5_9FUNG|nr:hypothetical protein BC936DRAFT_148068 [Jimgerdemannia flammicorona]